MRPARWQVRSRQATPAPEPIGCIRMCRCADFARPRSQQAAPPGARAGAFGALWRNGAHGSYPARRLRRVATQPAGIIGVDCRGEEPFFTVYVVPDFDSTADVEPVTLRRFDRRKHYAEWPDARQLSRVHPGRGGAACVPEPRGACSAQDPWTGGHVISWSDRQPCGGGGGQ